MTDDLEVAQAPDESSPDGSTAVVSVPPPRPSGAEFFWAHNRGFFVKAVCLGVFLLIAAGALYRRYPDPAIALLLALVAVVILSALWLIPRAQIAWLPGVTDLTVDRRQELEDKARATLAQAIGGTFFLVTGYFTWQGIDATRRSQQAQALQAEKTLANATRGQVTDRYQKAVALLGEEGSMAKRLGGIYALESVARESGDEHGLIVELLAAHVRRTRPRKAEKDETRAPEDTQAILRVLGRRTIDPATHPERGTLQFQDTSLRGAILEGKPNLSGISFYGADLTSAFFGGANLDRCDFTKSVLRQCEFVGARLQSANFANANCWEAKFPNADLTGANLTGASLKGADLFTAEGLTQAQIDSAVCDTSTRLPSNLKLPAPR